MLDALTSKATTWISRWFDDSPLPGDLTLVALDAEIEALESKKRTCRGEIYHLKSKYRDAARRAADLDGPALTDDPALRDITQELEHVVEAFVEQYRRYARMHQVHNVLQRYWLVGKERAGDDRAGSNAHNPWLDDSVEPPKTRDELSDWVAQALEDGVPPALNGSVDDREDPCASALAETVVTAARTTGEVPTLYSLLEDGTGDGGDHETFDLDDDTNAADSVPTDS